MAHTRTEYEPTTIYTEQHGKGLDVISTTNLIGDWQLADFDVQSYTEVRARQSPSSSQYRPVDLCLLHMDLFSIRSDDFGSTNSILSDDLSAEELTPEM